MTDLIQIILRIWHQCEEEAEEYNSQEAMVIDFSSKLLRELGVL